MEVCVSMNGRKRKKEEKVPDESVKHVSKLQNH